VAEAIKKLKATIIDRTGKAHYSLEWSITSEWADPNYLTGNMKFIIPQKQLKNHAVVDIYIKLGEREKPNKRFSGKLKCRFATGGRFVLSGRMTIADATVLSRCGDKAILELSGAVVWQR